MADVLKKRAEAMTSQQVKERATEAAGSVAGAVVDPKTGLSHLKSKIRPGRVLLIGGALLVAYLVGRRSIHM
ncbi:hypothetical protein [Krasilnikovia sp. M28-CT-15]|uniref:hypothetical protein n=1 Tax=Krasilnikovia sp. M28-CT-15 TaxID=3373540 RepID=UPI0038765D9E